MLNADLVIRPFQLADTSDVIALWEQAGLTRPWNDPERDIKRKMEVAPGLFIVGCVDERLIATAMGGYDGHRGWVNYLAVEADCRGCGYGRRIMEHLEAKLVALGCPKINLQARAGNDEAINFYKAAGYVEDDVVSLGKRLIVDD